MDINPELGPKDTQFEAPDKKAEETTPAKLKQVKKLLRAISTIGGKLKDNLVAIDEKVKPEDITLQNTAEAITRLYNGNPFTIASLLPEFGQTRNPDPEAAQTIRTWMYDLVRQGAMDARAVIDDETRQERVDFDIKDEELLKKIAQGNVVKPELLEEIAKQEPPEKT